MFLEAVEKPRRLETHAMIRCSSTLRSCHLVKYRRLSIGTALVVLKTWPMSVAFLVSS